MYEGSRDFNKEESKLCLLLKGIYMRNRFYQILIVILFEATVNTVCF